MSLRRVNKMFRGNPYHEYWLDKRRAPGVTTIIKMLDKPALPSWAARSVAEFVADHHDEVMSLYSMGRDPLVNALKGAPWTQRDLAAAKGTEIHVYAQQLISGEGADVPDHLRGYVDGYVRMLEAFDISQLATELVVAHRGVHYAGTADAVITIGRGELAGRTGLVDWKTGSGIYAESMLQTAAYACAEFSIDPADRSATERPLPPGIDFTAGVHLTEAGAHIYPLALDPDKIRAHFEVFRHVAWLDRMWKGAAIGDPLAEPPWNPRVVDGDVVDADVVDLDRQLTSAEAARQATDQVRVHHGQLPLGHSDQAIADSLIEQSR